MIQFQEYFQHDYPGFASFINEVITPIFGDRFMANQYIDDMIDCLNEDPEELENYNEINKSTDEHIKALALESGLERILNLGTIQVQGDTRPIYVYDITVSNRRQLSRNRKGIQQLITRTLNNQSGAFMLFHYNDAKWEWRFSYKYVGKDKEDTTESKRFTYLFGKNQVCKTAAQRFSNLLKKNGKIAFEDITEAFSVEKVSKEFFEKYKTHYEKLCQFVYDHKTEPEWFGAQFAEWEDKTIRDYVKKMMGRIVFLHFMQKKGWMGIPEGGKWGDGDQKYMLHLFENATEQQKENFLDEVLEPLFKQMDNMMCGGLFEKDIYDEPASRFKAEDFKSLLEFFSEYNFTIDENDPDDAEVGVDPEMLGRIFENLLEDNKDKGAFYTPKEIVQYMCKESLIAYLTTASMDNGNTNPREKVEKAIRELVTNPHEIVPRMNQQQKKLFGNALRKVRICDPAIGSGAFPMGLLNELVRCRTAIDAWAKDADGNLLEGDYAALKRDIVCNNIYGVDIEQGAIDIARLRFWLSIVVDEKEPEALPNFDYKFMKGNSLITTFDGEYVNLDTKAQQHINIVKMRQVKKHLYDLKIKHFHATGDEKHELTIEIKDTILQLISLQLGYELRQWYDTHAEQKLLFPEMEQSRQLTFSEIKQELPEDKQRICDLGAELRAMLKDESKTLAERAQIDIRFFDWRMMFTEVFEGEKPGFDIVIGNPPYIQLQTMLEMSAVYKEAQFETYNKTGDIYCLFVEQGFKLLNMNGILTYIMPNKWMQAGYGQQLREYLSKRRILNIVDFGDVQLFENATTYTCIPLLQQAKPFKTFTASYMKSADISTIPDYSSTFDSIDFGKDAWVLSSSRELKLINKLKKKYTTLENHLGQGAMFGIKTGLTNAFIIDEGTYQIIVKDGINANQRVFPFLLGRDIKPYASPTPNKYMILFEKGFTKQQYGESLSEEAAWDYIKKDYSSIANWLEPFTEKGRKRGDKGDYWWELRACDYYDEFAKPKIMYQAFQVKPNFIYDETGCYCNNSMWILPTDNKALLGLLNSKMGWWLISKFCSQIQNGYQLIWKYFGQIPIALEEKKQQPIITLVDRILSAKKNNQLADTTADEREIDRLVYDLYGLTEEEIKIVEGRNE